MDTRYHRQHYLANRESYISRNKKYKSIFDAILNGLKNHPCADCGQSFPPYVMDFDHVIGEKVINISQLRSVCSPALLLSEIKKCEIVCANCHRIRTHKKDNNSLSLEGIVDAVAKRRKVYDRGPWEELFAMLGIGFPPLPPVPKRSSRCIRKIGPVGTSWCTVHKSFIPVDRFGKNSSRWNGLQGQCDDCRRLMPSRISKRRYKTTKRRIQEHHHS